MYVCIKKQTDAAGKYKLILVGKPERRSSFDCPRSTWEDNFDVDPKKRV
jgi:hypothetical protein